jgi:hypothetical protein
MPEVPAAERERVIEVIDEMLGAYQKGEVNYAQKRREGKY